MTAPAQISYFAKIDPSQFWRQSWQYSVMVTIPPSGMAELSKILGSTNPNPFKAGLEAGLPGGPHVLIPYPQEVDVVLPFAAHLTHLLEGGYHVEHRGRIKQQQTISGTSGFLAAMPHPENFVGTVTRDLVRAASAFTGQNGDLKEKGLRSGYGWFHRFVWLLEVYGAIKRLASADTARATKCVWFNERDDQLWVVEPTVFRWRRDARASRFTYHWSFNFDVVEDFARDPSLLGDAISVSKLDPIEEMNQAKNALIQGVNGFRALLKRVNDVVDSAITAVVGVIGAGLAIIDGIQEAGANVINQITKVVNVFFGLSEALFNTLDNLALGPNSPIVKAVNELYISTQQAFDRAAEALNRLTAPRPWWKQEKDRQRAQGSLPVSGSGNSPGVGRDNEERARNAVPIQPQDVDPDSIGSSSYGSGLPPSYNRHVSGAYIDPFAQKSNTTRLAVIYPKDTIFDVAKREMGDGRAWHSLVLANGLHPPYIVPRGQETKNLGKVLRYEDPIRIPMFKAESSPLLQYYDSLTQVVEGRVPQYTGFASAAFSSDIEIRDTTRTTVEKQWVPGALRGFTCSILSGTGFLTQRTVRENSIDSFSLAIEGASARPAPTGATTIRLQPGQGVRFPSQGPLFFSYGTGGQVDVYLTGNSEDILTFTPALLAPLPINTPVSQIDEPFPFTPDDTTQYLLWLNEIPKLDPAPATPDMAFGLDLKLVRDSKGKLDMTVGPTGDADTVTGLEAYTQSMRIALSTRLGANMFRPEDGVPDVVGQKATLARLTAYMMFARRVVLSDPRTADILTEDIFVGAAGDIVEASLTALTVSGLEATVSVGKPSLDFPRV